MLTRRLTWASPAWPRGHGDGRSEEGSRSVRVSIRVSKRERRQRKAVAARRRTVGLRPAARREGLARRGAALTACAAEPPAPAGCARRAPERFNAARLLLASNLKAWFSAQRAAG